MLTYVEKRGGVKTRRSIKTGLFCLLGGLGILQSLPLLFGIRPGNIGNIMVYGLTASAWIYGLRHRAIDAFCSRGIGRWLRRIVVAGLAVWFSLTAFVAVYGGRSTAQGDEAAIVVLGAGLRGSRPGTMLTLRLQAALDQWRQNPEALLVVSGGQGPDEAVPEAWAMAQWLREQGVPEDKILQEDRSTSTWENFVFSRQLLLENGVDENQPIAYATSDFHCWRAGWTARQAGFAQARRIPAPTPISQRLPSWLREAAGVGYYLLFQR